MRVSIANRLKRGQSSLEYILLLAVVAVVVIASFRTGGLVDQIHGTSGNYFNTISTVIMDRADVGKVNGQLVDIDTPAPINGGWCPVVCPTSGGFGPTIEYKSCECPPPAFGGAYCTGPSYVSCNGVSACNVVCTGGQVCIGPNTCGCANGWKCPSGSTPADECTQCACDAGLYWNGNGCSLCAPQNGICAKSNDGKTCTAFNCPEYTYCDTTTTDSGYGTCQCDLNTASNGNGGCIPCPPIEVNNTWQCGIMNGGTCSSKACPTGTYCDTNANDSNYDSCQCILGTVPNPAPGGSGCIPCTIGTNCPIPGVCATAKGTCTTGTPSTVTTGTTNYTWTCAGTFGGATASCSLPIPVNGACGTTDGTCTAGTPGPGTAGSANYTWTCVGTGGGTTASCSAPCGIIGQACCSGNSCPTSGVCSGGSCIACGSIGQTCCSNNTCPTSGVCSSGSCVACGATGEACCSGSTCPTSGVCSASDTCQACGSVGAPCCSNNTCPTSGSCIKGSSEMCGNPIACTYSGTDYYGQPSGTFGVTCGNGTITGWCGSSSQGRGCSSVACTNGCNWSGTKIYANQYNNNPSMEVSCSQGQITGICIKMAGSASTIEKDYCGSSTTTGYCDFPGQTLNYADYGSGNDIVVTCGNNNQITNFNQNDSGGCG